MSSILRISQMSRITAARFAGGIMVVLMAMAVLAAPVGQGAFAQQSPPGQTTQVQAPPVQTPPAQTSPADPNAPTESALILPVETPERPALILRGKSKWDDGYKNITDAFAKLRAQAATAKLTINGRAIAVFVQSDDEGFTFEAMLPVDINPSAAGTFGDGVTAGRSPGGLALKFEHRGAYDDIESTYEAIAAYLDEKGLSARDELIEEFINETIGSDDTNLSVDIYVLLK